MKKLNPLFILLLLFSCTNSTQVDEEKEKLKYDLELAKRELQLERAASDKLRERIPESEIHVFSTNDLIETKRLTINGKEYTLSIKRTIVEANDPPFDEETILRFIPANLPPLTINSHANGFAVADINQDGQDEIVCSTLSNGTWASIQTYALSDKQKWYEPIEHYLWRIPIEENSCHSTMTWLPIKKQVKILTTSVNEIGNCADETLFEFH